MYIGLYMIVYKINFNLQNKNIFWDFKNMWSYTMVREEESVADSKELNA